MRSLRPVDYRAGRWGACDPRPYGLRRRALPYPAALRLLAL